MKILIIGASGYLGSFLCQKLKSNYAVVGTCNKNNTSDFIPLNLLLPSIEKLDLNKINPQIIIWCVKDLEHEEQISAFGLDYILKTMSPNTRFIYMSTMLGVGKNQKEDTIIIKRKRNEYLSPYFNGKIEGEKLVSKLKNYVIVRTGSIYGYDIKNQPDYRAKEIVKYEYQNKPFVRNSNLFNSFIHIEDLSNFILELLESDFKGIINVSGNNPVNYFDFYKHIAFLNNFNDKNIVPEKLDKTVVNSLDNSLRVKIFKTKVREIV